MKFKLEKDHDLYNIRAGAIGYGIEVSLPRGGETSGMDGNSSGMDLAYMIKFPLGSGYKLILVKPADVTYIDNSGDDIFYDDGNIIL